MQKFQIILLTILSTTIILVGYWHIQVIRSWIFYYGEYLKNEHVIIGVAIITPILAFLGIMHFYNDVTRKTPSITRKPKLLRFLTSIVSILAVLFVIYYMLLLHPTINYSDLGLILQIVGFIAYIPYVTTSLLHWVGEKGQEENTKQTIKTAAISSIVIGLILQISYFHG